MTQSLYGDNAKILRDDADCTIFTLTTGEGEARAASYRVFPGMELIYHDILVPSCPFGAGLDEGYLGIHHCQKGRREYCCVDGSCVYLTPGDLAIERGGNRGHSHFPLPGYKGISLIIDRKQAPKCLSCILADVPVDLDDLAQKFCGATPYTIFREKPYFEHIFSELYHIPDPIKKGYSKVKVLELLLFLSGLTPEDGSEQRRYFPRDQVETVKAVKDYLVAHLDEHITIKELCQRFSIAQTTLKTCFKGVYGTSIYAFIRNYRIESAARLLRETDKSILEIAGMVGYDNGSKFAGAFRDILGASPKDFRKCAVQTEPKTPQKSGNRETRIL